MLYLTHQPDTGVVWITSCLCRRIRVLLKVLVPYLLTASLSQSHIGLNMVLLILEVSLSYTLN